MTTQSSTTEQSGPTPAKNAFDKYFEISKHQTTIPREIRAGLTTFLAMSYVIFVNPDVLSAAIVIPGVDNVFSQLVMVTCLAAFLGSLVMGVIARFPFAQAPGMGLNAFFAYTVVIGMGVPWETALGAVFLSGVLFIVLSVIGVRKAIVQALPLSLKFAITSGIGAFLAFLGMKNAGIVILDEATLVAMGDFADAHVWLSIIGLLVIAVLMKLRVTGAILWGILFTSLFAIITRIPVYPGAEEGEFTSFNGFGGSIVAMPFWPSDLAFKMDLVGAFGLGLVSVVFTFFFVDFFDATGTLTGLSQRAGFLDEHGEMPRAKTVFSMDGLAAMIGAALGTSTTTAYVESAAGVEEGGRTGLTAITTGVLFLLAMFFWPLIGAVPSAATAPALIIIGALMMSGVMHIDWSDIGDSLPAFLTIVGMPFTFSIANGVSYGIIAYAVMKLLSGRVKEAHWMLYLLAGLLILRYVYLG